MIVVVPRRKDMDKMSKESRHKGDVRQCSLRDGVKESDFRVVVLGSRDEERAETWDAVRSLFQDYADDLRGAYGMTLQYLVRVYVDNVTR